MSCDHQYTIDRLDEQVECLKAVNEELVRALEAVVADDPYKITKSIAALAKAKEMK